MRASEIGQVGTAGERKYCSRRCAGKERYARVESRLSCQVCSGSPASRIYGMTLCGACKQTAHLTCWRKIRWSSCGQVPAELVPYRCSLCTGWHGTSDATPLPDWFERRRSMVGLELRRLNFDIDAARGWRREWQNR